MTVKNSPRSKLPDVGTTIFAVMSKMAREHNAINLSQGYPGFDCDPVLKQLVYHHMKLGHNQYAPMPGLPSLQKALSQKTGMYYDFLPDPDTEITITSGGTQALFTAITAFIRPGDEVIILEPAYDSYAPAVTLNGGIVVPYRLQAPDFKPDWTAIAGLVSPRTKMIITNTPHNPSGRVFSKSDFESLKELVLGNDLLLLSDEVYEHLIFDDLEHWSALKDPQLYKNSLVVFSFGKIFHATGWKMGYCIAPPSLTSEFRKVHQFNVFSSNTPIQYALTDYLSNPAHYLGLGTFFAQKRDFFASALEGSGFRILPCEGTYFQACDFSQLSDLDDFSFASWLTQEIGVASIPVSFFYTDKTDGKVIRFCFAKEEVELKAAAEKLCGVNRPSHSSSP